MSRAQGVTGAAATSNPDCIFLLRHLCREIASSDSAVPVLEILFHQYIEITLIMTSILKKPILDIMRICLGDSSW